MRLSLDMFAANAKACDRIWTHARLLPMTGAGLIDDGLVAAQGGRIVYAGPAGAAPDLEPVERIHCGGRLVTPGFVDCHTHLVYGGSRAREFEQRLAGASYEEIARAGGGILSTVSATRAASEEALIAQSHGRLEALKQDGVTTVEIKSGYGLDEAQEIKQLRAARQLGQRADVRVSTSFLGAHALPPEWAHDRAGYVAALCAMIPAIAPFADAVDGFCESIAFSPDEIARVFSAAQSASLPVRLHADQLSDSGGAALAARFHALSADHLEYASEAGLAAMGAAGTVAVLLPGAYYFLRDTHLPPISVMRSSGVRMALATDCNPGSSPLTSLLLAMNMGATLFRLTVPECLAAVTIHAAAALGLEDEIGTLEPGKACDLAIWDVAEPAELVYRMGARLLHARIRNGL